MAESRLARIFEDPSSRGVNVHILDSPGFRLDGLQDGDLVTGLGEFYDAMEIKGDASVLYSLDNKGGDRSLVIVDSSDGRNTPKGVIYDGGRSSYPLLVIGNPQGASLLEHTQPRHNELCGRIERDLDGALCSAAYDASVGAIVDSPDPLMKNMKNVVVDRFDSGNGSLVSLGSALDIGVVYTGQLYLPSKGQDNVLKTKVMDRRDPRFPQYFKAVEAAKVA